MKTIYEISDELKELAERIASKLNNSMFDHPSDKLFSHDDARKKLKELN